jgi:hypothetical protein
MYGDTGVRKVDTVTESIFLADPRVDRHHVISILSYHTMKIYTLSFPTCGLTHSVRDWLELHICTDSELWVVSYRLTRFQYLSNKNRRVSWIQFGCCKRCGWVLMAGTLNSRSIISPQGSSTGVPISSHNGRVQLLLRSYSSTKCGQIDHMYI